MGRFLADKWKSQVKKPNTLNVYIQGFVSVTLIYNTRTISSTSNLGLLFFFASLLRQTKTVH